MAMMMIYIPYQLYHLQKKMVIINVLAIQIKYLDKMR